MSGKALKTQSRGLSVLQGIVLTAAALLFLLIVTDDFAQRPNTFYTHVWGRTKIEERKVGENQRKKELQ